METYEKMMSEVKHRSIDYLNNKFEIDFFVETKGVFYYLDILNILKENKLDETIKNVILFDKFQAELNKLIYQYLDFLEKYLKSYLFSYEIVVSVNLLKEKGLKNILEFIYSDNELKNEIFDCEFDIFKIVKLKNKIKNYSLGFDNNKFILINNLLNALPYYYRESLIVCLENMSRDFDDLKKITNYKVNLEKENIDINYNKI